MLYRTHHPFLFPNNPPLLFPPLLCNQRHKLSTSSYPFPLPVFIHSGSSFPDMECVDAAPKTCFRHEISLQLSPQAQLCFHDNPQNVVSSDDFFVDQLLDFSKDDEFVQQDQLPHDEDDDNASLSLSISSQQLHHNSILSDLPSTELTLPADELANLEWLSHFVEDSFSGFSAPFPSTGISSQEAAVDEDQPENDGSVSPPEPCFKSPVPVKARSKRTRTGGRVWCLASPSLTESSSSSTTSSSSSSPASPWLIISDRFEPEILVSKKPKRKSPSEKARTVTGAQPPRRCSHCGVQKTPQWRTGPLGAKTLCNACGVRFKSGRLLPEYRPACSPTFSSELHSNHHRKVLEMRRRKETTVPVEFLTPGKK